MATVVLGAGVAGCGQPPFASTGPAAMAEPSAASEDARVADLLSRMSVERKVAQLIQPQINSFTAQDMARYRFGSYLNGGNGGPGGDEFAPAAQWLALADEMWDASTRPLPDGEPVIPTIWGTDAVHGHTNIVGATIFPHNVGLGATRDADLLRRIGAATAVEIEVTGIDWNFSPTVAVARDDRWGRSYESYSEDPRIVAEMGAALVEGLQGTPGSQDYLGRARVAATAKHFFADGGTDQGVDQGDVNGDIEELKAIHAVPYPAAIDAGVEVIMASFNSVNGVKMHGNRDLLTGLLRDEMGFEGVVVGDWNAHGQIAGCTNADCPQALMAGLDIYMVPDDWKALLDNLVAQVNDGTIPMNRLDEAVGRVLRLKMRLGLLDADAARPSARANAGDYSLLASPDHRAIAREAVAKSMVVLKNNGVLPIRQGARVLVAGSAADDIAQAAGGWTLTWQGGGELDNSYFPNATSIYRAIADEAKAKGGSATLSLDGSADAGDYDVAVVVFGEEPYAEFYGDRKTLVFDDTEGLELLRDLDARGIPTVAVFLSGRAMWMNRELNAADGFIAAWLPGSEGAGVSDILYGNREATGRLSFSWPADCGGAPVNGPDGALFNLGYGRSLEDHSALPRLPEDCGYLQESGATAWYDLGRLGTDIVALGGNTPLANLRGEGGGITARAIDKDRQEDAREIAFGPGTTLSLSQSGTASGDYRILYNLAQQPAGKVTLTVGDSEIDITRNLALSAGKDWREMIITEECAPGLGDRIAITSQAPMTIQLARIVRQDMPDGAQCSF